MIRILLFALPYLMFMGCQSGRGGHSRQAQTGNLDAEKAAEHIVDQQLTAMLDSMRYCYVKNVKHSNDPLLEFYKKTPDDFRKDSLIYYSAMTSFFNADISILKKLLVFQGDSSRCGWIYSPNPYSSIVGKWEVNFNKEMGSKVLIYAYLMGACGNDRSIPGDPSIIENIVNKIQLNDFSQWLEIHRGLNKYELCEKFRDEWLGW